MERVIISVKSLYEKYGTNLTFGKIERIPFGQDSDICEYYDLYDNNGNIVCIDGEKCSVVTMENNIMLTNEDEGNRDPEAEFIESTFMLTREEYEIATFHSKKGMV